VSDYKFDQVSPDALTCKSAEEANEKTHRTQDTEHEPETRTDQCSAEMCRVENQRYAPGDEAVDPLLARKPEERERRVALPERGLWNDAARGFDVEPALGCHGGERQEVQPVPRRCGCDGLA
jgi:hypothetical protein